MMTQSDLDADWAYEQAKTDHDTNHRFGKPSWPTPGCEWCQDEAQDVAVEIRAERARGRGR